MSDKKSKLAVVPSGSAQEISNVVYSLDELPGTKLAALHAPVPAPPASIELALRGRHDLRSRA